MSSHVRIYPDQIRPGPQPQQNSVANLGCVLMQNMRITCCLPSCHGRHIIQCLQKATLLAFVITLIHDSALWPGIVQVCAGNSEGFKELHYAYYSTFWGPPCNPQCLQGNGELRVLACNQPFCRPAHHTQGIINLAFKRKFEEALPSLGQDHILSSTLRKNASWRCVASKWIIDASSCVDSVKKYELADIGSFARGSPAM